MKTFLIIISFLAGTMTVHAHCGACGTGDKAHADNTDKSCCSEKSSCCSEKKSCSSEKKSCSSEEKSCCGTCGGDKACSTEKACSEDKDCGDKKCDSEKKESCCGSCGGEEKKAAAVEKAANLAVPMPKMSCCAEDA